MEATSSFTQVTTARPEHIPFLTTLERPQLKALIMVAVHGMNYWDAARLLNVPRGSVNSQVHRGRKHLRRMIAEEQVARIDLKALAEWENLDATGPFTECTKALKAGKAKLYRIAHGTEKDVAETERILRSLVQPRHGPK